MTVNNCFLAVLDRLSERLRGRSLADLKLADVNYLCRLLERKTYLTTLFLTSSSQFLPAPQGFGARKLPQGNQLQASSFLGHLLSPTTMDTILYQNQATRKMLLLE